MNENQISMKFKEWACSFSGCDGGKIKEGGIWFSGIEWGLSSERDKYYNELADKIGHGEYKPDSLFMGYDSVEHLKYPFGVKMAKLYTAIQGYGTDEYRSISKGMEDDVFKLNLYPVAFPNESDALWDKYKLAEITGLESKHIYRTWCFLHRFPWFHEQVDEQKPKLIIGTGVSYLTDFVVCFAGKNGVENIHKITIHPLSEKNSKTRTMYWARIDNDVKTLLVVLPFFGGSYGLNSDYLLQKCGEEIRQLLCK